MFSVVNWFGKQLNKKNPVNNKFLKPCFKKAFNVFSIILVLAILKHSSARTGGWEILQRETEKTFGNDVDSGCS